MYINATLFWNYWAKLYILTDVHVRIRMDYYFSTPVEFLRISKPLILMADFSSILNPKENLSNISRSEGQAGHWCISYVIYCMDDVCEVASRKAGCPPSVSSSEGSGYCTVGGQRGINKWRTGLNFPPSNCLVFSLWEWSAMELFKLFCDLTASVQRIYYMVSRCGMQ